MALSRLTGPRTASRIAVFGLFLIVLVVLIRWVNDEPYSLRRFENGTTRKSRAALNHVRPLIGTVNGGHVFPGASLPYGMAKPVADTASPSENAAGFVSDDAPILGFSHLHDSGTGGAASLGNFPLFVHPGCPDDDYARCAYEQNARMVNRTQDSVTAQPGYFGIGLENTVQAEMTATMHTALYKFLFRRGPMVEYQDSGAVKTVPSNPLILVDLNDLARSLSYGAVQVFPDSGRIVGEGTFRPSFGVGVFNASFCVDFRGAAIKTSGIFVDKNATHLETQFISESPRADSPSGSIGAWVHFQQPGDNQILARVGLSFISAERACENAESEIPDFDFEQVRRDAEASWNEKLSVVEVDNAGVSEELQITFWSGLYRSLLSPQNYTGENQLWDSSEPYFDSFYCIWDSFRAQHPLLTIIDPSAQAEMVRTLLDVYRHLGHLPDCRMSFSKGYTQGGSNADVVIADAFIKNITEGIDWDTAYKAVLADAEIAPRRWSYEGRGNRESWETYKYIAVDHVDHEGMGRNTRSVSRTLEYAYDDYSIAVLAEGLGKSEDAAKYMARSGYWKNVWNPDQRDLFLDAEGDVHMTGFKGFPQPRRMDGAFKYQNTRTCSPTQSMHNCYFDTMLSTYEGSPWLYSFYVPQDMSGLIEVVGGDDMFNKRLDYFHSSGIAYMGNEQSFLTVFQFHYAGRPGMSSQWVHNYIPSQFNASINGIPGNDDCAMGAFSSMAMMGFFPVAGQDVYLLTAPFFPEVRLRSRGDQPAVIRRIGSLKDIFIQSAKLNGEEYTKNWISHEFFLGGGVLELTVGPKESLSWGVEKKDRPPSYPT